MHRENRVMSGAGTSYFYGTNIKKSAVVCVSCVRCVTQELRSRQVITELHRYTSCGELPGKPPQPTAARPADLSQMSDLRNCYTATLTQIPATSDVRCSRLSAHDSLEDGEMMHFAFAQLLHKILLGIDAKRTMPL